MPLCKHHHLFLHEHGYYVLTGLDPDAKPRKGPRRWRFASPTGRPILDHRKTLGHYLEQLALLPDPPETG